MKYAVEHCQQFQIETRDKILQLCLLLKMRSGFFRQKYAPQLTSTAQCWAYDLFGPQQCRQKFRIIEICLIVFIAKLTQCVHRLFSSFSTLFSGPEKRYFSEANCVCAILVLSQLVCHMLQNKRHISSGNTWAMMSSEVNTFTHVQVRRVVTKDRRQKGATPNNQKGRGVLLVSVCLASESPKYILLKKRPFVSNNSCKFQ